VGRAAKCQVNKDKSTRLAFTTEKHTHKYRHVFIQI